MIAMSTEKTSIFQRPVWVALFALTAAVVWGWAYPLIKLGFAEFNITPDMTGSKMLFAGIRFCISGLIILAIAKVTNRSFGFKREGSTAAAGQTGVKAGTLGRTETVRVKVSVTVSETPSCGTKAKGRSTLGMWFYLLIFSLLNTTLHYMCFYIGLSHCFGARAAILNSMSVFTTVILACAFFKTDKMNVRKILGCVMGFAGVLSLNIGGEDSGSFTLLGDGMIILNALCGASASLLTRGLGKRIDVFVGTGYSLGLGGALLVIPGLLMQGQLPTITLWGIVILILLIGISTIGFSLYNKLLTCNPVGKVAIYNSLIPVVGAITSCLCLGETFYWKYILAGALATAGIYIINKGKR